MNFEAIIGLEIHVEMKTHTKMFSSAPIKFKAEPNTNITYLDLAYPGSLPRVNKNAVINAIRVCNALHMEIDDTLYFDRKNYFYADLPKGYQITQQFRPIGQKGYLEIDVDGEKKRIKVERLHMEEDTAMQHHYSDYTLLDYNRAGIPLVEIVSYPEIRNGKEARKYVEKIKEIVTYLDVSDGKMENGSLRCDVNISLRPYGSDKFGTKVEVKNLNSTANIEAAIDIEMSRQAACLLKGIEIHQETRRFDELKEETVLMRTKTEAADYKYFSEGNIPPIFIGKDFINRAIETSNELYDQKLERFLNEYKLNEVDARILLSSKELSIYYDEAVKNNDNYQQIANFIISEVLGYLNKNEIEISNFNVKPDDISDLVNLLIKKEINSKQGKDIFAKMIETNKSPLVLKEEMGATIISDPEKIRTDIIEIIKENPTLPDDYKNGKTRAQGFVMGLLMKKNKGKVDPILANKLIVEELLK